MGNQESDTAQVQEATDSLEAMDLRPRVNIIMFLQPKGPRIVIKPWSLGSNILSIPCFVMLGLEVHKAQLCFITWSFASLCHEGQ